MALQWVVNNSSGSRMIGGKLLAPGEGTYVDNGPLASPLTGEAPAKLRFFTAAQLAAPTAEMLGDRVSTFVDSSTPELRYQSTGLALLQSGSGGSGGSTSTGHIQTVYSTLAAAASANPAVGIGTTVYIGTAPANYIKYEVVAQPSATVGNWQALKGAFAASIVNLNIVPGRGGANLSIHVDPGNEATVTVDGTVNPFVLIPADANGGDYVLNVFERQGEAPPALVSILRTSGSGGGTYCLE